MISHPLSRFSQRLLMYFKGESTRRHQGSAAHFRRRLRPLRKREPRQLRERQQLRRCQHCHQLWQWCERTFAKRKRGNARCSSCQAGSCAEGTRPTASHGRRLQRGLLFFHFILRFSLATSIFFLSASQ